MRRNSENMNRMGRFTFTFEVLESDWLTFDQKCAIFERILLLDCRTNFANQTVEYIGFSDIFDEVSEGMIAPRYDCFITWEDENFSYEWKRID